MIGYHAQTHQLLDQSTTLLNKSIHNITCHIITSTIELHTDSLGHSSKKRYCHKIKIKKCYTIPIMQHNHLNDIAHTNRKK